MLPTPKNFLRIAEICDLYEVTVKKDFRGRPQHSWDFLQESKRFNKNVTIISTFLEIFNQHFSFFHYSDSADSASYLIFMKVVNWKKKLNVPLTGFETSTLWSLLLFTWLLYQLSYQAIIKKVAIFA